jgi:hypothetical protein
MVDSIEQSFVDYYEVLGVTADADTADIEEALEQYEQTMTSQLNNPFTMKSARYAINVLIPGIRQHLLSGQAARKQYNQQLTTFKQQQEGKQEELADDEGLDLLIRQPFFFDPYNSYDTEQPAYTLRGIAERLDAEWERAHIWIADPSTATHPLVGYLTHAALRPHLAERVNEIIQAISRAGMPPDEAIECCIMLLNPEVERPRSGIQELREGGSLYHAGTFVADRTAESALTLYHRGRRGCTFGRIESRTPWLTLQGRSATMRFALVRQGARGASTLKIPLFFDVRSLTHNVSHTAEVVLYLENYDPPLEMPLQVMIHVPALAPRVVFDQVTAVPLFLGSVRRGQVIQRVVIPRNTADEGLIPLVGQIDSNDAGARAEPIHFHHNQPVALIVDTSNKAPGSSYDVTFHISYHLTPGASGPTTLQLHGEILPTIWQSMLRVKPLNRRLVASSFGLFAGLIWFGSLGGVVSGHILAMLAFFFAIPLCIMGAAHISIDALLPHLHRAAYSGLAQKIIAPLIRWGVPAAAGVLLALICGLVSQVDTAFLIGGLVGALMGGVLGFLADSLPLAKRLQTWKKRFPVMKWQFKGKPRV